MANFSSNRNNPKIELTQEKKDFLVRNYPAMSSYKLAYHFDVSQSLIFKWLEELGLKNKLQNNITPHQEEFVKNNVETMTVVEMAAALEISPYKVSLIKKELGLSHLPKKEEKPTTITQFFEHDPYLVTI